MTEKVVAVRTSRRLIGLAAFAGRQLHHADILQLSSSETTAQSSALGFVRRTISRFAVDAVAIETPPNRDTRATALVRLVVYTLHREGVPVWKVELTDMLGAFGIPPLASRAQLRFVGASFWPILDGTGRRALVLDAALLGLYIQVERLLNH